MADDPIPNWIKSQKEKGYSEDQLGQILQQKGYPERQIDGFFKKEQNNNTTISDYISEEPLLFRVLIYSLVNIASISLLIIFLLPIVLFQLILNGNVLVVYAIIGIISVALGGILSYAFDKICSKSHGLIIFSSIISIALGAIFSVNSGIHLVIRQITGMTTLASNDISDFSGGPSLLNMLNFNITNPYIAFSVAFVLFNLAFVIRFIRREDKNYAFLLFYLLPILMFFLFSAIANFIVGSMLTQVVTPLEP